ncbi:hypothetical protein HanRHA438_Chr11g0496261 [Helianthus annuus]|nr:hypothetical protein HanRHA438_Chr11g0496261 [Helianthus annuus]
MTGFDETLPMLMIDFHMPPIELFSGMLECHLSPPCMAVIIFAHKVEFSFLYLILHLTIRALFADTRLPMPKPPSSLGATTLYQGAQLILFLSVHPPHKNFLRRRSRCLITCAGALNNER